MPVTAALFERWKKAKGFASDRQACLALGVSNGNPGHWREGKNAHAAVIERMARDLGHQDREIAVLLFESMAEAANADAESRKTYERLAKKVRTLALTAVAVLASSSFPTPSKAREHGHAEAKAVFIMRTTSCGPTGAMPTGMPGFSALPYAPKSRCVRYSRRSNSHWWYSGAIWVHSW